MKKAENYWEHKISLFLHDPVHKALKIPGHEERASEICEFLHLASLSKDQYQNADWIASGLSRAILPGYNSDETKSGSIDFVKYPLITHPLVANKKLEFSNLENLKIEDIQRQILDLLKEDLGIIGQKESLKEGQLNTYYGGATHEKWLQALFNYLFFAFKKRLRKEKIANLGALWDFLPADTRIPDHSIWSHCGLTSAIGSVLNEDNEISLTVFSITPVQAFISKARKLRDSWVGSVILSYLSFIGIRTIIKTLGPDHIMYPSLHDQSLVEAFLAKEYNLKEFLKEEMEVSNLIDESKTIASFPNKFVFLSSSSEVKNICQKIESDIQTEWERISKNVMEFICDKNSYSVKLFLHQISDYWTYSWASSKLLDLNSKELFSELLETSKWQKEFDAIQKFSQAFNSAHNTARLYGTTHSLVQGLLASVKLKPTKIRKPQAGEKCPLCGEHEVLHNFDLAGKTLASDYSNAVQDFWNKLRGRFNSAGSYAQIGQNERLCAVCSIKRFLPRSIKDKKDELLSEVFKTENRFPFPSTTELAARSYIKKLTGVVSFTESDLKNLYNHLHNAELNLADDADFSPIKELIKRGKEKGISYTNRDKYYALLLMDGDKMGDLINGETLSASWATVIHPELKKRLDRGDSKFGETIKKVGLDKKRTLNPSLHASISDALNSFARFAVAPILARSGGRLIYAGGDDVCAVLPLDTALETAQQIAEAYTMSFVKYSKDGVAEIEQAEYGSSKIGMHLGKSDGISISGAIVIGHHKEPLKEMFRDAHRVLDDIAKNQKGRNALAIRLKKRSGGDRDIGFKWNAKNIFTENNETILDSFKKIMQHLDDTEISSTLAYKMTILKEAVRPLAKTQEDILKNKEKIIKLFKYEVGHSGLKLKQEDVHIISLRLAGLCIESTSSEENWFNAEGPIIARFLASNKEDK